MSCEGGGGKCRPSDHEVVKLEDGSMRRKVGAGISGAGEVLLYIGESLAVGTGRWMSRAGFSSGCYVPVSPSRKPIAHAPRSKEAFLVPIDKDLACNRALVVWRLAGEGGELSGGNSSEPSRNSIIQRFPPRYSSTKHVPKS